MPDDILNAATALGPTCKERKTLRKKKPKTRNLKHKKYFKEKILTSGLYLYKKNKSGNHEKKFYLSPLCSVVFILAIILVI